MNKRIFYLDLIRAIAIILIVLIHITKWFTACEIPYSLTWSVTSSIKILSDIGVPLFLMISGALLLNRDIIIEKFLKRRISRVLIPFFFWIIFMIIEKFIIYQNIGFEYLINIVFKEGYVWYIWMMVSIYLVTPIINSFLKEYGLKGLEFFLGIWLITILLNSFGMYPFYKFELDYFARYLGYFVLGYYLDNKKFGITERNMMIIGIILFSISTILADYFLHMGVKYDNYVHIMPVLQGAGFYLFIKYFTKYSQNPNSIWNKLYKFIKNSKCKDLITSLSICSYGIYLTHYLFIMIVVFIDKYVVSIFTRNPFKWVPFLFTIIILLSWGLIYILSKIKYVQYISGTK